MSDASAFYLRCDHVAEGKKMSNYVVSDHEFLTEHVHPVQIHTTYYNLYVFIQKSCPSLNLSSALQSVVSLLITLLLLNSPSDRLMWQFKKCAGAHRKLNRANAISKACYLHSTCICPTCLYILIINSLMPPNIIQRNTSCFSSKLKYFDILESFPGPFIDEP